MQNKRIFQEAYALLLNNEYVHTRQIMQANKLGKPNPKHTSAQMIMSYKYIKTQS